MGLSFHETENIETAAWLHGIGKTEINTGVLIRKRAGCFSC
jgi:response regulator RpfG family c-di-GMP phosphodiesterase